MFSHFSIKQNSNSIRQNQESSIYLPFLHHHNLAISINYLANHKVRNQRKYKTGESRSNNQHIYSKTYLNNINTNKISVMQLKDYFFRKFFIPLKKSTRRLCFCCNAVHVRKQCSEVHNLIK